MATSEDIVLTSDPLVNAVFWDSRWVGTVTFGFPDLASDYGAGYGKGEADSGFFQISTEQQRVVREVFAQIESFTKLSFDYAGATLADISFGQSSVPATAYAYSPGGLGDVWFGDKIDYRSPRVGDLAYKTHFHEIGHALGLKHPHEWEASNGTTLDPAQDWMGLTIMSYRSYRGAPTTGYSNETFGYPTTYMPLDILALQHLYGANYATNSTATVYTWNQQTGAHFVNGVAQPVPGSGTGVVGDTTSNRIFMAIWDGGGEDTYDLSNYTASVRINLEPGAASSFYSGQMASLGPGRQAENVHNAFLFNGDTRSIIEHAKGGSSADTLIGNAVANKLWGNGGQDQLEGAGGADTLDGGDDNDTLRGGSGNDILKGGAGSDLMVGGLGLDRAVYGGVFRDIAIYQGRDGEMKVGARSGLDTVAVETLQFGDRRVELLDFAPYDGAGPALKIDTDNYVWIQPPGNKIELDFGEPVEPGTGRLHLLYADGQLYRSYTAEELATGFSGTGYAFALEMPDQPANYYIEVDAGFVVDRAGNPSEAVTGADTWNFKIGGVDDYPEMPAYRSNTDPSFVWADSSQQYSYPTISLHNQSSVTIAGYLNGPDEDSHRLSLAAGKTYVISWESIGPNGADDGGLTIRHWSIDPVLNRTYGFFPVAETSGTLIFQPRSQGDSSLFITAAGDAGAYRFTVAEWAEGDDFVNDNELQDSASTGTVTIGTPISGILAAHGNTSRKDGTIDWPSYTYDVSTPDTDWMKVQLVAGRTYTFTIRSGSLDHPDIDTSGPVHLQLLRNYVTDGEPGTPDPYSALGSGPNFTFTATETGTYWLRISPIRDNYGEESYGGYTLRVDEGVPAGFDNVAPTLLSAAASAAGTVPTITLTFSEKIEALGGTIRLTGPGYNSQIDVSDESQVSVSGSTLIIRPDIDRFPAGVTSIELPAGVVADLAGNLFQYGTTTSFAFAGGAAGDDYAASTATAANLKVGDDLLASIGEGDGGDWVRTSLQGGVTYDLRAITDGYGRFGFGPGFTAQLAVRDAAGNLLAQDLLQSGGSGNARLLFKPAATGTYYLEVTSASGSGLYLLEALPFGVGIAKTGGGHAERLDGTAFADTLDGVRNDDLLDGRGGDDKLTGGDGNDLLAGGPGTDTLDGGAGDDFLDGGKGADSMTGSTGNDIYVVNNSADKVLEASGGGTDTVRSAIDYTLPGNVEKLVLTGGGAIDGIGNTLGNAIAGNTADNRLEGGAGNDRLDGGRGADTMVGGAGNDLYFVDEAGDRTVEAAGGGIDTVHSSIGLALAANVERLVLTGYSAIDGTGNGLANILTGNSASNRLVGGDGADTLDGGGGPDTMVGGSGGDTYVVDERLDETIESAAGGTDRVLSAISWTLAANVENLTLTGGSAVSGTGNGLANVIAGNAAANVLNGAGGADNMRGGSGNDTYVVDHSGDRAVETSAAGGVDTVKSSVSFTLGAYVEKLVLTGSAALSGTGNNLANSLTGNSAANQLSGAGGDDTLDGKAGGDSMKGGSGNDTYIVDSSADRVIEESASGGIDTVKSSVSHALAANVEKLVLTGSRALNGTGNSLANSLTGNSSANILDGKGGADTMTGYSGNDVYRVDHGRDRAVETSSAGGYDIVESSVSFALGTHVEKLVLTGGAAINGTGNGLANSLVGNSVANVLDGKGGADKMTGYSGNDTYVVDHVGDKAIETSATGGFDTVKSSVAYTLGANVERLILTGSATVSGTGNGLANSLFGNSVANLLDGKAGADTMTGYSGNDTYIVDHARDKAVETSATGGTDTVKSSVTFALGANVERLVLTGTAAVNGTGNSLANRIEGNAAANILTGNDGADTLLGGGGYDTLYGGTGDDLLDGGAGKDVMSGRAGNDTYVVADAGDKVIEKSVSEGVDTVLASVSFTLGANVENLTLTSTALNGTGNALANLIIGNNAANLINGGGGADRMKGGRGDDTYVVGHVDDVVVEAASAGTDTVNAWATHALGANVENLVLFGSAAIDGSGNDLANQITGNGAGNRLAGGGGNDRLSGGNGDDILDGGAGGDTMIGGSGKDRFHFDAPLGSTNVDDILDFKPADDTIVLDRSIFVGIGLGTLAADAFRTGSSFVDADDRILHDPSNGRIYFDADGVNGAYAPVLFARVDPGTALTHADFVGVI